MVKSFYIFIFIITSITFVNNTFATDNNPKLDKETTKIKSIKKIANTKTKSIKKIANTNTGANTKPNKKITDTKTKSSGEKTNVKTINNSNNNNNNNNNSVNLDKGSKVSISLNKKTDNNKIEKNSEKKVNIDTKNTKSNTNTKSNNKDSANNNSIIKDVKNNADNNSPIKDVKNDNNNLNTKTDNSITKSDSTSNGSIDTTNTVTSDIKKESPLIEMLNKRKEELKKILSQTEAEKQISLEKQKQEWIKIQKEIIQNLNNTLNSEIGNIKNNIINNKKILNDLSKQKLLTNKQKREIKQLNTQNKAYQNKLKLLNETIKENQQKIERYKIADKNQQLLLQKAIELKKELEKKNNTERNKKIRSVLIYFSLLLFIYFLIFLLEYLYFRNKVKKKYIDHDNIIVLKSLLSILLVIYFIWSLFYIFPQYIFILFFAFSAILVISAPIVWSYISSILLLWKIHIGDRLTIEKWKIDWIITNIWLISLTLNELEDNRLTDKFIKIWTRELSLQPYKIQKDIFTSTELKKMDIKKEDVFIKDKNKPEIRIIDIVTSLDWQELEHLIQKVKNILKKKLIKKINNENYFLLDYNIKEEEKIEIKITIKTDKEIENKIKLQIYNLIKNMKKDSEKIEKKEI